MERKLCAICKRVTGYNLAQHSDQWSVPAGAAALYTCVCNPTLRAGVPAHCVDILYSVHTEASWSIEVLQPVAVHAQSGIQLQLGDRVDVVERIGAKGKEKRRNLESASCTLAKCSDKAQRTTFKDTLERNLKFRDHLGMRRTSCSIKARQAILYHHAQQETISTLLWNTNIHQGRRCETFLKLKYPCPDLMTPLGVMLHYYWTEISFLRQIWILKLLFGQNGRGRPLEVGFNRIPTFHCQTRASVSRGFQWSVTIQTSNCYILFIFALELVFKSLETKIFNKFANEHKPVCLHSVLWWSQLCWQPNSESWNSSKWKIQFWKTKTFHAVVGFLRCVCHSFVRIHWNWCS